MSRTRLRQADHVAKTQADETSRWSFNPWVPSRSLNYGLLPAIGSAAVVLYVLEWDKIWACMHWCWHPIPQKTTLHKDVLFGVAEMNFFIWRYTPKSTGIFVQFLTGLILAHKRLQYTGLTFTFSRKKLDCVKIVVMSWTRQWKVALWYGNVQWSWTYEYSLPGVAKYGHLILLQSVWCWLIDKFTLYVDLRWNSTSYVCCGLVVQHVVEQIHNKWN